jgi:trigger factor
MPEIDQAAVGMTAGEAREVGLRFADDHRMPELRGRPGTATVKLVEVKEKVLPPLDDDFARTLGEFENLEAVRTATRRELETRREAAARRELEDKIVDALLQRHPFGVPDALVLREVSHLVEHGRERMRRQGIDPERVQWDYAKLVADLKPTAERSVRRSLLLEAIAEREGLAPGAEDVDAEIERLATAMQRPALAVRRMMEKSGDLEALRQSLRERLTLDFLVRHATIRE